jgi:hypothetical protein
LTMTLVWRINAPVSFPRLPSNNNGMSETICLNSAFARPHNCCMLRLCGDWKVMPPADRLHVDLSLA